MTARPVLPAPRERGRLRISDRALSRIVTRAAADGTPPADGPSQARSGPPRPRIGPTRTWIGSSHARIGPTRARVRRHGTDAEVGLRLVLPYPGPLAEGAAAAAGAARRASAAQAGVRLRRTRILITSLEPGGRPAGAVERPTAPARARRAARRWTARRVPASLLAAAGLTAATAWWLARVRGAPHPAAVQQVLDDLATARVGDLPVLVGAAVTALLGIWLTVMATTGTRRSGWQISPAGGTAVVEVDRRLVEREVRQELGAPDRLRVRARRTVRITTRLPLAADTLRAAALDAYARLGFDGPPPTVVRAPRPAAAGPLPALPAPHRTEE
ncbi:hypothetical protein ACIA8O_36110 [Kitasatospora sp. NPDC051853]|uniref:hypothetical protein n=1 Tax=Kitasatospora sp. NPDC051853 TaxID=3364058 RepID=UPI003795B5D3